MIASASVLLPIIVAQTVAAQVPQQAEREAIYRRYFDFPSYVHGGSIQPHWLSDGSSFWFAAGPPDSTVVWLVDPNANTKTPVSDGSHLRQGGDPATAAIRPTARGEALSPDGRWVGAIRDQNLWLRSTGDGREVRLTSDGVEGYEWHIGYPSIQSKWSPDSRYLAVRKIDFRGTPRVPILHYLDGPETVEWIYYPRAGEPRGRSELHVVEVESGATVVVDVDEEPGHFPLLWRPDGSELLFLKAARYWRSLQLMAAEPVSGDTRVLIEESAQRWLDFPFRQPESMITLLGDGRRFIWTSDRDGWNHLYLYDLEGKLIRRLTRGPFPVGRVVAVDEQAGWVYFMAQSDPDRPYDTHLCRVTLDGMRFEQLTHAPGHHDVQLTPSKRFFLDAHSSVDRPPVVELRRADGALLQILARADTTVLMRELRWRPPEEFVVKAADGRTDLHGVLYKPYDFDPRRSYPVLQTLGTTPRTFTPNGLGFGIHALSMAHLGYIAVSVNGRGTQGRGVAFANADRGHLGRLEAADGVAALRQLAETRPYMDLERIGVIGGSYGGFSAIRAMLFAPDAYSAGVAINPITDMAAHWRNESFLGRPEENREAYEYASNLRFAGNLRGKLLLIAGTSDRDVPVSHTMRMADALIQAGRQFDMLILPGQPHVPSGASRSAMAGAIRRYFEQHLKPE